MAYFMDVFEESTLEFLSSIHDPKGCFLDIGANIGLISIPFATYNKAAGCPPPFVYCIEAVKDNQLALAANIKLSGLEAEMKCINFAVGEVEKDVEIQVEHDLVLGQGTGTANIVPAGGNWKCVTNKLKVRTIDSLVLAGTLPGNVTLIKIDTDGYDLFAMMGARELLRQQRPVVFGEFMEHCLKWHSQSIVDVDKFFRALDYEIFIRVNPHSNAWRFARCQNYAQYKQDALCVPKEKLKFVEKYLE